MVLGPIATRQLNMVGERQIPTTNMFSFEPKQQTEDKSISSEEARQLFTGRPSTERKMIYEKLKSEGFSFEDEVAPTPEPVATPAPTGGFEQGVKNISAGIASGASQAVGGTLGIVGDFLSAPFSEDVSLKGIFTGENVGGLGQLAREETARQQEAGARAFGAQTESMGYKGGKFGTGLGLAIATPGGVLGQAKNVGMLGKVGLGATQGAIETGKFLGLTEGRLGTPGELALGATIGGALPVLGAGFGKAKEFMTKKLPESLVATGISTPTDLLKTSIRLNKLGDESFKDATSASKWLLKNKIAGDIEQRTTQLNALAKKGRETAQNLLKGSKVVIVDDIANQAKAGLESLRPKLESAGLTKYTTMIDDFINKKVWTAEDLNKARTFMADKGGIFKHSGEWVDSLQKENLQDIWKAASKYLDETIPGFRRANKDYEVASALSEAIGLKASQDQARQVFSLVNLTGAGLGGTVGGLATGGDPMSILQGAALGVGGRYIFSPSNMSKLAIKLSEYAPKAEATKATKAIETFVKSRGEIPMPKSVVNLISKTVGNINPFKDIAFIKKLGEGKVKGLSKEALQAMKGAKTMKDAMARAKNAGVEDEIRRVYPLEGSRFDLSKNKKGFVQIGKVDDAESALINEAKKYKSAEEFVKAQGTPVYHGTAKDFTEFKLAKSGERSYEDWGRGVYLTPSESSAKSYARQSAQSIDKNVQDSYKKLLDLKSTNKVVNRQTVYSDEYIKALKDYQEIARDSYIANEGGKVMKVYIDKGAKTATYITPHGVASNPTIADKYRKSGMQVINIKSPEGEIQEIVILDPAIIKTEAQLKDIYNKATK